MRLSNPESPAGLLVNVLFLSQFTNSPTVASSSHSFLEEHVFSEKFVLGSFLVISHEPVNFKLVHHGRSMSDDNET